MPNQVFTLLVIESIPHCLGHPSGSVDLNTGPEDHNVETTPLKTKAVTRFSESNHFPHKSLRQFSASDCCGSSLNMAVKSIFFSKVRKCFFFLYLRAPIGRIHHLCARQSGPANKVEYEADAESKMHSTQTTTDTDLTVSRARTNVRLNFSKSRTPNRSIIELIISYQVNIINKIGFN